MTSRVWELIAADRPAVGTYATLQDTAVVMMLAAAGLDFVRFDPLNHDYCGRFPDLMAAAHEAGLTVWVRVANDPQQVATAAALGVDIVTIPEVHSPSEVVAALDAAREVVPEGSAFAIGGQIEDATGLAAREAIVATDGLRVVHSGRNDLARSLGVPGEPFHPAVLAAEELVVEAAMSAGKQVSLHHPLTEDGIRRARIWWERGARIFTFDTDRAMLARNLEAIAEALAG